MNKGDIQINTIIHKDNKKMFVMLRVGDASTVTLLSAQEARAMGLMLFQAAESCETEQFLANFLREQINCEQKTIETFLSKLKEWRYGPKDSSGASGNG
jgi:hypothetical protein